MKNEATTETVYWCSLASEIMFWFLAGGCQNEIHSYKYVFIISLQLHKNKTNIRLRGCCVGCSACWLLVVVVVFVVDVVVVVGCCWLLLVVVVDCCWLLLLLLLLLVVVGCQPFPLTKNDVVRLTSVSVGSRSAIPSRRSFLRQRWDARRVASDHRPAQK